MCFDSAFSLVHTLTHQAKYEWSVGCFILSAQPSHRADHMQRGQYDALMLKTMVILRYSNLICSFRQVGFNTGHSRHAGTPSRHPCCCVCACHPRCGALGMSWGHPGMGMGVCDPLWGRPWVLVGVATDSAGCWGYHPLCMCTPSLSHSGTLFTMCGC